MALTAARFDEVFKVTKPTGYERYVIPETSLTVPPGGNWYTSIMTLGGGADTQGSQVVNVGGAHVGADTTGLANNSTVYTATVTIDGSIIRSIKVTGSKAQTFASLITELNTNLMDAVATLTGGNILVTSNKIGNGSKVSIVDGTLFSSLTGYVGINAAIEGVTLLQGVDLVTNEQRNELYDGNSDGNADGLNQFTQPIQSITKQDLIADNLILLVAYKSIFDTSVLALAGAYIPA